LEKSSDIFDLQLAAETSAAHVRTCVSRHFQRVHYTDLYQLFASAALLLSKKRPLRCSANTPAGTYLNTVDIQKKV
jgi:hypothetical protein